MANNLKSTGTPRQLLRDRRGISSVEFALVCSLFFMMVLGVVDFSRAMWEWNAAAKATHWGVRYAIVNDMVSKKMASFSGVLAGLDAGSMIDPSVVVTDLGTDIFTCNNSGCNGNGDIGTSFDDVAFGLDRRPDANDLQPNRAGKRGRGVPPCRSRNRGGLDFAGSTSFGDGQSAKHDVRFRDARIFRDLHARHAGLRGQHDR